MHDWLKAIPESELEIYRRAGYVSRNQLGRSPALIVVDVTFGFTGHEGLSLEEAIDQYASACGPAAWDAVPQIQGLLALFRRYDLPIVYTYPDAIDQQFTGRATKGKCLSEARPGANDIPEIVAPRADDWVMGKTKASAFFQTPLSIFLATRQVDSIVVCGGSTSGCVRATAVDSCSSGFDTFVVDDACFDRSPFAHTANLFDLSVKYADVVSLAELEVLLEQR